MPDFLVEPVGIPAFLVVIWGVASLFRLYDCFADWRASRDLKSALGLRRKRS